MSFNEKLAKKINPKNIDITKQSFGGTPELTGNDMLASMIGTNPLYSELKTCVEQSTSCNPQFVSRTAESFIVMDLINYFNERQKLRYKLRDIPFDELEVLAKLSIDAQSEGVKSDIVMSNHFECARSTYQSKYQPIFEEFYIYIRQQLQNVSNKGNERLKE